MFLRTAFLWCVLFVYSPQISFGRGRHAEPAIPQDIQSNSSSSFLDEGAEVDSALLLRRYSDTRELAQMLGIPFDQNFVSKAFDFYSKRGMLADDPNVSESDIRSFLREVGGVEDSEMLVKVGMAFVEKKKEEFQKKSAEEGKDPKVPATETPNLPKAIGGEIVGGETGSPTSRFPFSREANAPMNPTIASAPITQVIDRPIPVFPSTVAAPPPIGFPAPIRDGAPPSVSLFNEVPSVREALGGPAPQQRTKTAEAIPGEAAPTVSAQVSAPMSRDENKLVGTSTIGARIPSPEKMPATGAITSSDQKAQEPKAASLEGAEIVSGLGGQAPVPTEKERPVRTLDAGIGMGSSVGAGGETFTMSDAQTVVRNRKITAGTQPKSLLDRFYRFLGRRSLAATTEEIDPDREPSNFGRAMEASNAAIQFAETLHKGVRVGWSLFPLLFGLPFLLWFFCRIAGLRRRRSSSTAVAIAPRHYRDLN